MTKTENDFKRLVKDSGSSPKAADEIWKWYNHSTEESR
jgi:hypothetical protein